MEADEGQDRTKRYKIDPILARNVHQPTEPATEILGHFPVLVNLTVLKDTSRRFVNISRNNLLK